MAGLDGIQNRIDPGDPVRQGPVRTAAEEAKLIKEVPGSLELVLQALEADHEFLLKGDVFTTDLLELVHCLQVRHRSRPDAHAPPSPRVHSVLRRVGEHTKIISGPGRQFLPGLKLQNLLVLR